MLLVVISAFWFLVAVRRKQRAEYGAGREQSQLLHRSVQYSTVQHSAVQYSTVQLLHRLLIPGLVLLFLAPVPWLLQPSSYTCLLRHLAPTLAFSIVLSRWGTVQRQSVTSPSPAAACW